MIYNLYVCKHVPSTEFNDYIGFNFFINKGNYGYKLSPILKNIKIEVKLCYRYSISRGNPEKVLYVKIPVDYDIPINFETFDKIIILKSKIETTENYVDTIIDTNFVKYNLPFPVLKYTSNFSKVVVYLRDIDIDTEKKIIQDRKLMEIFDNRPNLYFSYEWRLEESYEQNIKNIKERI